ncbi:Hypothetical protein NTJ_10526 [Nesidiocoris tenuis]|uniref:Uncharacterized protein n=1 Tax=Nesidiocoris tenuis TaxID=355587 RepID=A0ABN7B263_9HEMI|nr:Hypothetical protein NTJ_10526 [Nesidiocoris tenuis]
MEREGGSLLRSQRARDRVILAPTSNAHARQTDLATYSRNVLGEGCLEAGNTQDKKWWASPLVGVEVNSMVEWAG